jgi:ATP-binding cassette subfamily F protein 3
VRATKLTPNNARSLLGKFLFSGEDAEKPLDGLSGGERQRLSLAILVHSGANVLILDEPTNHLDVESREALEDALQGFPGSVLLVSHDRALLDAVGTRTVAVEDGSLRSYEGGWADYVRERDERKAAEADANGAAAAVAKRAVAGNGAVAAQPKQKPARSKNAVREAQKLEREIEAAEAALQALEDELGDPAAWTEPGRVAASTERHEAAKRAIEELYARYERVAE